MTTWTKQKLGEIAEIIMGQSPESKFYNESGNGLPFFQGVKDFGNKYPTVTKWTTSSNKVAIENDILFSVRAPVGDINVTKLKCGLGRGVCAIRSKHKQNEFLYFLLRANINKIINIGNGSIYDSINKPTLENIELLVPDLPTQQKIASVLSAYDDLIENNEKRIKALEEMAQLLYTEWLMKFKFPGHEKVKMIDSDTLYGKVPEGWLIKLLGDIATVVSGYAFKSSDFQKTGIRVIKIKNIKSDNSVDVENSDFVPSSFLTNQLVKYILKRGDIIIAMTGATAGKVGRLFNNETMLLNQRVAKVKPSKGYYSLVWGRIGNRDAERELYNLAGGAAQPNMSGSQIENIQILIPTESISRTYDNLIFPLLSEILLIQEKNQNLVKIRYLLIPKLVSNNRNTGSSNGK